MEIIPAIDIKDGLCVRLFQGDYGQTTVYDQDPIAVASRWVEQGATRLHIVDLDGARAGYPVNTAIVQAIVQAVPVPVQLGGGLRNEHTVATALESGVARVILGTAALHNPPLVERLIEQAGSDSIIVGIDARDGYVATDGWLEVAQTRATDLASHMASLGVQRIVYTDISRDGTLAGPNIPATAALVRHGGPAIIASGGIAHLDNLRQLAETGVEAAIVGRALYTGAITLASAIDIVHT